MGRNSVKKLLKPLTLLLLFSTFSKFYGQSEVAEKQKGNFWNKVQFGGGFGLSIGSGYTDISLLPSAIYNLNQYASLGFGLQGSIVSQKDVFNSTIYGIQLITIFNPLDEIQLSIEMEQVRVNNTFRNPITGTTNDNFWNTGLFVGGGYRMENITTGVRYNLLFNKENYIYTDALMPFVRIYF